ncbi:MAG: pyridoxal-dependent decarboxylase, exosortase A system-associated [Actinobacteria bacterium]|nr:pyridoxal-dependent decarboxylase, exosortase A system-associated [Actinomycetota bacterium]
MKEHLICFEPRGGVYEVGGRPLQELADELGATPFFAYDRVLLDRRIGELRACLPEELELSYAVKANPMPELLAHLQGALDGFDVASGGELAAALEAGADPERIGFAGPGKTDEELRDAVRAGVAIELESPTEAARVTRIGEQLGVRPRVAVRVNPDFMVRGSGMRMGGGPQQFGVDAELVPELVSELATRDLEFLGFHVFSGSQNLSAEILCEAQRRTVDLALELAEAAPGPVAYLNLGGGFGIPYFPGDQRLDLAAVGANLDQLLSERVRPALPEARVVLELGRYVVGECGVYATRIIDRKRSRGTTFLVVDGGLHHQLAASGNFGQVIRRNYPVALAGRTGGETETVTVVGCLCTPLDLLAEQVELPRPEVGELVLVFQAGAYGLTASPTAFLSHPQPREVFT